MSRRRTVASAAPTPTRRAARAQRRQVATAVRFGAAATPTDRLRVALEHLIASASGPQADPDHTRAVLEDHATAMLGTGDELLRAWAARPLRGVS